MHIKIPVTCQIQYPGFIYSYVCNGERGEKRKDQGCKNTTEVEKKP